MVTGRTGKPGREVELVSDTLFLVIEPTAPADRAPL